MKINFKAIAKAAAAMVAGALAWEKVVKPLVQKEPETQGTEAQEETTTETTETPAAEASSEKQN